MIDKITGKTNYYAEAQRKFNEYINGRTELQKLQDYLNQRWML